MASRPRLSLVTLALAGFALYQWQARRCEREDRARLDQSKPKPPEVTTWEGEGGALKDTGAQLGPDPATPSAGPPIKPINGT